MALAQEIIESKIIRVPFSGCWLWTAGCTSAGYGMLVHGGLGRRGPGVKGAGKRHYAHRFSWEAYREPIPENMFVLHECDVRACVNPDHLFIGSQDDNMKDMEKKGRRISTPSLGQKHGCAKLTDDQAKEIYASKLSGVSLAEIYRVSPNAISRIKKGIRWKHIHSEAQPC
jgi:HNH endonuclease